MGMDPQIATNYSPQLPGNVSTASGFNVAMKLAWTRFLIVATLLIGLNYLAWRYTFSINWDYWFVALLLLAAETYSYADTGLFGLTMWRSKRRPAPPPPPEGATADIFIACYNEPVDLVRETTRAAVAIDYPHRTYLLDDGESQAMRAMAEEEGAGYIVRSDDWQGRPRHAKAGNLNNALFQADGEFILILDADQIPSPQIFHKTLGYFRDPKIAFVQTPQWYYNLPPGDPFGSDDSFFYGPVMQAKDGWNAALLCGTNVLLRREALMQLGITYYARELETRTKEALRTGRRRLKKSERDIPSSERARLLPAFAELTAALEEARIALRSGHSVQEVTWQLQKRARVVSETLVLADLAGIRADLAELPGLSNEDVGADPGDQLGARQTLNRLAAKGTSPLAAFDAVRALLTVLDMDRADEAQPVMPMSTISVTEDFATSIRLHSLGWRSAYHDEILVRGLAPEDLGSALAQRLRWTQGNLQVVLREKPLTMSGLSPGQRLMYFYPLWSHLSGFVTVVYLLLPAGYLVLGWLPVKDYHMDFWIRFAPYFLANRLMFMAMSGGVPMWRGIQYYHALFPLWINAVCSSIRNVYFGQKLSFVVTPKTRQAGSQVGLVRIQLLVMAFLVCAVSIGWLRLMLGQGVEIVPIAVNTGIACYGLVMLSVVISALRSGSRDQPDASLGMELQPADQRPVAG